MFYYKIQLHVRKIHRCKMCLMIIYCLFIVTQQVCRKYVLVIRIANITVKICKI